MEYAGSISSVGRLLICSLCLLVVAACQKRPETKDTEKQESAVQEVLSGALEGRVRLAGEAVPTPAVVSNTTDPAVCGRTHTLENLVVSARDRSIRHVIIALTDVPADKIPPRVPQRLVLDNIDCRFSPHASVLVTGDIIEARNSDPILHTTHLYGGVETNIALPFQGNSVDRKAERPGMISVKCDVHGWMQAYIRVDEHPFHAVTDSTGSFRIPDIPPGDYILESWHETLGSQQKRVHVRPGTVERIEIEYPIEVR